MARPISVTPSEIYARVEADIMVLEPIQTAACVLAPRIRAQTLAALKAALSLASASLDF